MGKCLKLFEFSEVGILEKRLQIWSKNVFVSLFWKHGWSWTPNRRGSVFRLHESSMVSEFHIIPRVYRV